MKLRTHLTAFSFSSANWWKNFQLFVFANDVPLVYFGSIIAIFAVFILYSELLLPLLTIIYPVKCVGNSAAFELNPHNWIVLFRSDRALKIFIQSTSVFTTKLCYRRPWKCPHNWWYNISYACKVLTAHTTTLQTQKCVQFANYQLATVRISRVYSQWRLRSGCRMTSNNITPNDQVDGCI